MKLASILSGGKDSIYAYYLMLQQGFEIPFWLTFIPQLRESYLLHSWNLRWVSFQAKLCNVEHKEIFVSGDKEEEVVEILCYLEKLKKREGIEGIVCGAIRSEYQKHRFDMVCEELGLRCYAPLWHKNGEKLLREIVESGFEFIVVYGGEDFEKWIGEKICQENITAFIEFLKKVESDISGEGGEYETFVVKTPFWKNEIKVKGKKVREGNVVRFVIEKCEI
jgi:ABC transporter with metal-binding/Fe-S-binding domain ATP-binding protein